MSDELFDKYNRITFDALFMGLAFFYSKRSIDPNTKHGAVFVKDNVPVSFGYNGPIRGFNEEKLILTRPQKYKMLSHAEIAGIKNAARIGVSLVDTVIYITGKPCSNCMRDILDVGVKEIVYGPLNSCMIDEEDWDLSMLYINEIKRKVALRYFPHNPLECIYGAK